MSVQMRHIAMHATIKPYHNDHPREQSLKYIHHKISPILKMWRLYIGIGVRIWCTYHVCVTHFYFVCQNVLLSAVMESLHLPAQVLCQECPAACLAFGPSIGLYATRTHWHRIIALGACWYGCSLRRGLR